MSGQALPPRRVCGVLIAVALAASACHHTRTTPNPRSFGDCRAARAREADTRIHIDGPYVGLPHLGDSLILIVNDREAWRGVYDPCHESPGRTAATDHAIQGTDSVLSLYFQRGASVAAKYRIGGKGPSAYIVRTAPPPE